MASYIVYEKRADDREHSKIGGSSLLPKDMIWPKDRSGRNMLFLASISSELLMSECNISIPKDHVLSVFCPYKKGDIEHAIDMARGREPGFVISHLAEAPRQEFDDPILEAKKLELNKDFETDEDEFSEDVEDKIGGNPNWLQDKFDYSGADFVMQLSGMYFDEVIPTHKGIFLSGVLYVFYDPSSNHGTVALQYS